MKWIKENKCKSLIAFFGVFIALFTALDKGFDFWEEHIAQASPQIQKRVFDKPISIIPDYVPYKDRTLFKQKAKEVK